MSALGSLVVKLGLEYAEFTGGLDKSEQAALASAKRVQDTFDGMKSKLAATAGAIAGGLAAGFTVAAFKSLIGGAIETGAALDDLAMQTGSTVEALSGLAEVGKFNDMGPEKIGAAMNVLTRNLAGATEESKGAGAAIKALGLDMDKFRALKPEDQMQAVATALDGVQDGAGKSAVMMALYGKEGAQMLPFMKDLASVGELQAKVTAEQAAAAAQLDDNWVKLTTTGSETAKEVAMGMVPAFDEAVRAAMDVMAGTGGMREMLRGLVADGSIKQWTTDAIKGLSYVADAGHIAWRVLQSIGKGLGGLAAALVQALQGDFRGAWNVLKDSGQDVIDTFDSPTIGARFRESLDKVAVSSEAAGGSVKKAALDFRNLGEGAKGAKGEADKLAQSGTDLAQSLLAQDSGLSGDFHKKWDSLSAAYRANKISQDDLIAAQAQLLEQQPAMKKAMEATAKAAQTAADARNKEANEIAALVLRQEQAAEQSFQAVNDRIASLVAEESAISMASTLNISLAEAIERVAIARLREEQAKFNDVEGGRYREIEREIQAREKLLGQVSSKAQREDEARGWADMWQSVDRTAHDVFVNVLEGGQDAFKRLGNTLKASVLDVLYQMTVRKWIINIGTSVFGAGFGAAANAATGGSNGLLGTALQGAQMYQGLTSGTGLLGNIGSALGLGAASAYSLGGAAALGASSGVAAGGGLGLSLTGGGLGISAPAAGYFGGVSSGVAGGAAASSGTLSGALSAIPGWGWALAAVVALAAVFGKKPTPHAGAASTYSEAGGLVSGADIYRSSGLADVRTYNAGVEQVTGNVAKAIGDTLNATAKAFGQTAGYEITTAFADDTSKDGAWGSLIIKQMGEAVIDWRDTQTSKWAPREFADGEAGSKEYLAEVAKSARDALVGAIGSVDWATDMLTALGESPTLEGLAQTVQQINAAQAAFDALGKNIVGFGALTDGAISQLVKAAGSIDGLVSAASAYYDNFYSEAEKTANVTRDVAAALADVGLQMPTTREEFRALVESQMALGDAGTDAVAALLGVSGAFASVTAASETAADAAARLADEQGKAAEAAARAAEKAAEEAARAYEKGLERVTSALDRAMRVMSSAVEREMAAAQSAFDARITVIDAQISAAQTAYQSQQSILSTSLSSAKSMQAEMEGTVRSLRDALASLAPKGMEREFSVVASGGDLSKLTNDQLIGQTRGLDTSWFGSREEYLSAFFRGRSAVQERERMAVLSVGSAASLSAAKESQMRDLEEQYKLQAAGFEQDKEIAAAQLKATNDGFEGLLKAAQDQIAELNGTKIEVMSLGDSITNFASAIAAFARFTGATTTTVLPAVTSIIDGSHAGGLPYVPFNGYVAELHQGERVLTADEAKAYQPMPAPVFQPVGPGNAELLAELRAVRARLEAIEAASRATAGHTAGTDRKLARVIKNDALATEVVTP